MAGGGAEGAALEDVKKLFTRENRQQDALRDDHAMRERARMAPAVIGVSAVVGATAAATT